MTLLRPNFRPESWAQNAGNGISGVQISKNFREGMPPDPPTIASISAMIPSHLRLDPPLAYHPFSPLLHTNLPAVNTKNSKRHIMIYPFIVVSRINLAILQRLRVQVLIVKLSVKYRYLMNLHKHM